MSEVSNGSGKPWLKWLLPLLFIALAALTFQLLVASRPQPPSQPVPERTWSVATITAAAATHQPELTLYGKVEAPYMTTLSASVTAFVSAVNTAEGRQVAADELLVRLDPHDVNLLLAQRRAELDNVRARIAAERLRHQADQEALLIEQQLLALAERAVSRFENLARRQVGSENQLDDARRSYQQQALALSSRRLAIADHPHRLQQLLAELQRNAALLESAELDLARTRIQAPFAARIARLQVAPGDRVRSGDPLLSLYSLDRLEVRAQIPSRWLATIRSALARGDLRAQARLEEQRVPLRLDRLAGEVDGGRAGVDALFAISGREAALEPGRALTLSLRLPPVSNSFALPPQALYGVDRIYRVTDGRLEAVRVQRIGDRRSAAGEPLILITSDALRSGDRVLVTQLPNAIHGLRVKEAD